ncbi:MAG: DUF2254 domain-containing protein [Actinomycetota bacterium]|nr:DUF2254 domain-containing protein [Actinomycetota bacterium]
MIGRLRTQLQTLQSSFWLVPALITAGFMALAEVLVQLDRTAGPNGIDWAFSGDAEAARGILSTIAGSLITVAGLSFSITIVTLQLVSSQFTPRAVRGFLSDRVNQSVAGMFVGIFAYCLVVLRSVRGEELDGTNGFVPALAVSSAIGLALVALAFLLLFIHHMGQLIQVSNISARIARQTLAAVGRLYPADLGEREERGDAGETLARWRSEGSPDAVRASRPGYVRRIDADRIDAALADGMRAHIAVRPGDFVTESGAAIEVWPGGELGERALADLARTIDIQSERDVGQDVSFGIRQLTDIALRALSPGINDPTTAVTCIGYLQAIIERLAGRRFPAELRRLEGRDVTLVARRRTFDEYADAAFAELGRYGADNVRVASALLLVLASVARAARAEGAADRVDATLRIARDVAEHAREKVVSDAERHVVRERLQAVESAAGG